MPAASAFDSSWERDSDNDRRETKRATVQKQARAAKRVFRKIVVAAPPKLRTTPVPSQLDSDLRLESCSRSYQVYLASDGIETGSCDSSRG